MRIRFSKAYFLRLRWTPAWLQSPWSLKKIQRSSDFAKPRAFNWGLMIWELERERIRELLWKSASHPHSHGCWLSESAPSLIILNWNLIWDLKEGVINVKYDMITLLWSGFRIITSIKDVCNTQGFFGGKIWFSNFSWKQLSALPSFSCWCLDASDRSCNKVCGGSLCFLCQVNSEY